MQRDRVRRVALVLLLAVAGLPAAMGNLSPLSAGAPDVESDFNGDGYSDLAVGATGEDVAGIDSAGAINVIYGGSNGLTGAADQVFRQGGPMMPDDPEEDDSFGSALAAGDFNGDGFDDLAIGVPGEAVGGNEAAGAVHVLFGSNNGLKAAGSQFIHQNSKRNGSKIKEKAEFIDSFGETLTAGDFGKSNKDDLAIGAPGENTGGKTRAGAVHVLYGSNNGLAFAGNQLWSQNSRKNGIAVKDRAENDDHFGASLGHGNFGYSGLDDLAIGVESEKIAGMRGGAVNVLYATADGLRAGHNQFWHQDSSQGGVEIKGSIQGSETFANSVAGGNFGKSNKDDLAIGVGDDLIGGIITGAVNVLYGSDRGLRARGNQLWHQDSPGILETNEASDSWGSEVAAGNLGNGGKDDLAVGNFREDVGAFTFAGAAAVLYGSANGLTADGDQSFTQDTPDVQGVSEAFDFFGTDVTIHDFGRTGRADLVIAANTEDFNADSDGVVHVLYGDASGVTTTNNDLVYQGATLQSQAVQGTAEDNDSFGSLDS
jgi:FG-GAP repeat